MFDVPIDKIIPVTNARAQIASLVRDVQKTKSLYVLTRGGKPAAVLASIDYIHNNSLTKTASPAKATLPMVEDKKETAIAEPKPAEAEVIVDDDANNDLPAATNNVSSSVAEESFDKEQPVRISIK